MSKKAGLKSFAVIFSALMGALVSESVQILLKDSGSTPNWIGFIVVISLLWLLLYWTISKQPKWLNF